MKHNETPAESKCTVIRRCPVWEIVALIAGAALLLLAGILLIVWKGAASTLPFAICLFSGAVAAALFAVEYLWFSVKVENRKVTVRRLLHGTEEFSFLEFSWKIANPDRQHSTVLVFGKGKQLSGIHYGTKNSELLFTFNHSGKMNEKERAYLRRNGL